MAQNCWNCGAPPTTVTRTSLEPVPVRRVDAPPAPDLTLLFKSNDPPRDSVIPSIQSLVSDGQRRVDMLDAQIALLVQQRDETAELMRRRRGIISAVRRVPADLVCEIFTHASAGVRRIGRKYSADTSPWTLAHICGPWRQYAISYPFLWTFIELSGNNPFRADMLGLQLIRSASAPLDIYCLEIDDPNNIDPRCVDILVAHCDRWRSLHLMMDYHFDWLRPIRGRLLRLEALDFGRHVSDREIPDFFTHAPQLRRVKLGSSNLITLPWVQITHYRGSHPPQRQFEILKMAPNLVECYPDFQEVGDDEAALRMLGRKILLPHLRHLELNRDIFLDGFTTPSLETLYLQDPQLGTLPSLIRRSACTLTKLALVCAAPSEALIPALQALPALRHFFVDYYTNFPGEWPERVFLDALTINGTSSDLCPTLESLAYGYSSVPTADPFLAMVRSRAHTGHLKRVRLVALEYKYRWDRASPTVEEGAMWQILHDTAPTLRDGGLDVVFHPCDSEDFKPLDDGLSIY
ncbi:hypothetical protein B0H14DRAFT_3872123 [Mycena olivaceomarginata]|nr:hypothetical protein B0H14DRAFT_3872123 [Mycena olivaceomarginata]